MSSVRVCDKRLAGAGPSSRINTREKSPSSRLRIDVSGRIDWLPAHRAFARETLNQSGAYSAARLNSGKVQRASISRLKSKTLAGSAKGNLSVCQTSTMLSTSCAIMRIRVQRAWGDAQTLFALGDRRIIDRLDIDRMPVEQQVGRLLAELGIADEHRHDMGRVRHHRQARRAQRMFGEHRLALVLRAKRHALLLFQKADGGCRGGGDAPAAARW